MKVDLHAQSPALALVRRTCGAIALMFCAQCFAGQQLPPMMRDEARSQQSLVTEKSIRVPIVEANDILFTRLPANSGLSQNRVSHIIQDNQGFMWFGTQYGLNRFDGYKFKVFTHDPHRPESLGGVYIKALFKDHNGVIWVGCDQFLDRFDPVTESFTHYHIHADGAAHQDATIRSITEDSSGSLWLATDSGLFTFNPITGQSVAFRHVESDPQSLSSSNVKYAGADNKGNFWIANDAGLDLFDRSTGLVSQHVSFPETRELSFFEDSTGMFWIFHASGPGLASFNRKTNTLTRFIIDDRGPLRDSSLGISSVIEDAGGTLWFGTNGAGLFKLDRQQSRFVRYKNYPGDPQSLSADAIVALFQDREGNIWTALHGLRVNVFPETALPFKKLVYGPAPEETRGGTMVNAVYEDTRGTLWLSYVGMLAQINRESGARMRFSPFSRGIAADVLTITEDNRGGLWFGTTGAGLTRLNMRDGTWHNYRHDDSQSTSLSNDAVARLLVDHRGTIWAATWAGLDRYDEGTDRFYSYSRVATQRSEHYLSMAEDSEGLLWLGSNDYGLQTFDPLTGHFQIYLHKEGDSKSLSNNRVNSVIVDRAEQVWIGTQDGLDFFDREKGDFTVYDDSSGLGGNVVSCILEDDAGDLWMSTNKGISRFNRETKRFTNYTVADGLPGPDLSGWGSCSKSQHGEMFFGGYAGATAFFPAKILDKVDRPNVRFTEFDVAGVSAKIGKGSPLKKAIEFTNDISLSYLENNFAVGFSALSFRNADSSHYRYRLGGLESQWHEVGNDRRLATFTTLPSGKYRLEVQAAISDGPWSESAVLAIQILPPWWATWWFRSVTIAVALFLLVGAYYFRLGQIGRHIRQRFEVRNAERERIARDLHDTLLQTIQGSKLVADGVRDLEVSPNTKQALDKLSQWLAKAMDEGRAALESLREFAAPSGELPESLHETAKRCAPDSMRVTFSVKGDARYLHPIVKDEVYQIASEAVRNACNHSRSSLLTIEIQFGKDLLIQVVDSGCGFDPQILVTGKRGHFGIAGMKERAAKIGAQLWLDTSAVKGTQLILRVPGHIVYSRRNLFYDDTGL
jgi:ligand-binding sensor domain-containing protein